MFLNSIYFVKLYDFVNSFVKLLFIFDQLSERSGEINVFGGSLKVFANSETEK